ncbi:MAG: arylsulfatase [Hyphomicrobiaceae bacterium]|jgi:arylsulfatase
MSFDRDRVGAFLRCTSCTSCTMPLGAMLLVAILFAACSRPDSLPLRTPSGQRPNLLLVTIDTLRADRIGAYGNPHEISPNLDRFAASGVRFGTAIATASETAPAVAGLITGRHQHRSLVGANLWKLPDDVPTLATRLREAGWATGGFVANLLIGPDYGFGAGFDEFEFVGGLAKSVDAHVVDAGLAWLDAREADGAAAPWFLWLHLMDPHGPYNSAPDELYRNFPGPSGALADYEPPLSETNFGLGVIPRYQVVEGLSKLGEYIRRYDADVAWTDQQLGRVFERLEGEVGRETLTVVTADHGESLVEHDEFLQHGWFVYDATVKVPLVLAMRGRLAPRTVLDAQFCGVDLVPTLTELLGVPLHPADVDGVSAATAIATGKQAQPHDCYSVGARNNHPFAVRSNDWKFVHTRAGVPGTPGEAQGDGPYETVERMELYDLNADPGESVNLVATRPEIAAEMRERAKVHRLNFHRRGLVW